MKAWKVRRLGRADDNKDKQTRAMITKRESTKGTWTNKKMRLILRRSDRRVESTARAVWFHHQ